MGEISGNLQCSRSKSAPLPRLHMVNRAEIPMKSCPQRRRRPSTGTRSNGRPGCLARGLTGSRPAPRKRSGLTALATRFTNGMRKPLPRHAMYLRQLSRNTTPSTWLASISTRRCCNRSRKRETLCDRSGTLAGSRRLAGNGWEFVNDANHHGPPGNTRRSSG